MKKVPTHLLIYYDNYCPNCTRFARLVQRLDWRHRIEICRLRNLETRDLSLGIDAGLAEKQMASYDGRWAYGYPTLVRIFQKLPAFWPALPFFWLLKLSGLGQILYLQLAVNRKIIPLHCSEDGCKVGGDEV